MVYDISFPEVPASYDSTFLKEYLTEIARNGAANRALALRQGAGHIGMGAEMNRAGELIDAQRRYASQAVEISANARGWKLKKWHANFRWTPNEARLADVPGGLSAEVWNDGSLRHYLVRWSDGVEQRIRT